MESIKAIGETGNIPYFDNSTGVLKVKTIPIKELCGVK